ncbi:putative nucleotidyltransferase component of viral defense system [Halanaerobium saccharolyticum]|uniref:Putative nucleotidyltransferase component of viral defense system n=1 Tax=Halanaerobium saccharolyticum TaxID=43595 RepID=A0A4R7Z522_9FIRM|nr:nucleotidyl transferase AbiEii/AbiGii toxin family protein [Halanaerobium saccharolyticum]RAK08173.1 putative nucleotidyltransferase component of viral defense system [Halanaerobium saccharolyticum]TDW04380.1 putative nucleotidyltransferase component of viral defense system [Halanaerobium saccharolyticum]TDX59671.1 putative nucleotidyltransferase component of viral defense system [Halanaerobium saccharolyticum]
MSKNLAASVLGRLKNISKELNLPYNLVMQLFVQERLLYRLSLTEYKDNFLLKGGLLLYSMTEFKGRPTKDIDFLLRGKSNKAQNIEKIIKEIANVKVNDGVRFKSSEIKSQSITEGAEYKGQRIKLIALMGQARIHLQIDIGFGDIVVPEAVNIRYPSLLDFDPPEINAYSLESVIAEKFEAMVSLALLNSRMKDFYDIYTLMKKKDYNGDILKQAVLQTFNTRGTNFDEDLIIFSEDFKNDQQKIKQWQLFLKRMNKNNISFESVIENIKKFLKPIYEAIYNNENFNQIWNPQSQKWSLN